MRRRGPRCIGIPRGCFFRDFVSLYPFRGGDPSNRSLNDKRRVNSGARGPRSFHSAGRIPVFKNDSLAAPCFIKMFILDPRVLFESRCST